MADSSSGSRDVEYYRERFFREKVERELEPAEIQRLVDQISRWMDTVFEIPGVRWRFGFDALIGLIPGLGDVATTLVSLSILGLAGRCGVPRITVARMALNVAIDMLVGAIPVVGDLFDVWWKANARNAALLRERLAESTGQRRRATFGDWVFVGVMILALILLFVGIVTLMVLFVAALWNLATGR